MSRPSRVFIIATLSLSVFSQGCGLLFGGEQKVDTKSSDYVLPRLDKQFEDWHILQDSTGGPTTERSDVAFENRKNSAIISMNSVCGPLSERDLGAATRNLLMGIGGETPISQRDIDIEGQKARETVVLADPEGTTDVTAVKVKAIVLHKGGCTYDLLYIARPQIYEKELSTFDNFVKGFHVR